MAKDLRNGPTEEARVDLTVEALNQEMRTPGGVLSLHLYGFI